MDGKAEECFSEILGLGTAGRVLESYAYFNRGINAQHRKDYPAAMSDYNKVLHGTSDRV